MAAPARDSSSTLVRISLSLPFEVLSEYEAEAKRRRVSLETVFGERLSACVSYTSKKPLYLTDIQRGELETLTGRNYSSPEALVTVVRSALALTVDGTEVTLSPTLLARLKSRCFGKPFADFLRERVVTGLEEFAGMR